MQRAAFVPAEMRLQFVGEMLKRMTIRELAHAIHVDPRAVHKYKNHQSHPTDEVFTRILFVAKTRFSDLYESFMVNLENEFKRSEVIPPKEFMMDLTIGEPVAPKPTVEPPKPEASLETKKPPIQTIPTLHVHEVIDRLGPETMVHRKLFGSLLYVASKLRKFTPEKLVAEFNCPIRVASEFCERMVANDFASRENGSYVIKIEVTP